MPINRKLRTALTLTVIGFVMLFIWLFLAIGNLYGSLNGLPRNHFTLLFSAIAFLLLAIAIGAECTHFRSSTLRNRVLLTVLILLQGTAMTFAGFLVVAESYSWFR